MAKSKHDKVANRIAKRQRTTYNRGPGVDVKGSRVVVEVETANTVGDAARQLYKDTKKLYTSLELMPRQLKKHLNITSALR